MTYSILAFDEKVVYKKAYEVNFNSLFRCTISPNSDFLTKKLQLISNRFA